jgi:outer membrane immunogenic protein
LRRSFAVPGDGTQLAKALTRIGESDKPDPFMTKVTLAISVTVALSASVFAGPVALEKNVAPVAPACTWTGFYVGVNGGVGWQKSTFGDQNYASAGGEGAYYIQQPSVTYDNVNGVVGGQVGFNYQWRDLVLGIEADADYSGNSINKPRLPDFNESDGNHENYGWYNVARIDFQGSVRGKLGISLLDNKAMIYATGGAAFVHGDWSSASTYYSHFYDAIYDYGWTGEDWRWGLIGGMGIEYKLNCRWSVKAEALYTWLAEDVQETSYYGSGLTEGAGPNAKFIFADELYSFRLGVNYSFNGLFGH